MIKKLLVITMGLSMFATQAVANIPFQINKTPGQITLGNCHMDSCSWSKSVSTKVIQNTAEQVILDVTILGGSSPYTPNKKPKIIWNKQPHKITVVCSYDHPSVGMGEQLDELPLNEDGVPGVLYSAAGLYFNYCHSYDLGPDSGIKKFKYNVQNDELE